MEKQKIKMKAISYLFVTKRRKVSSFDKLVAYSFSSSTWVCRRAKRLMENTIFVPLPVSTPQCEDISWPWGTWPSIIINSTRDRNEWSVMLWPHFCSLSPSEKSLISTVWSIRLNLEAVTKRKYIFEIIHYESRKGTFSKLILQFLIWCLLHVSKPKINLQYDGCIPVYRYGTVLTEE